MYVGLALAAAMGCGGGASAGPAAAPEPAPSVVGTWTGALDAGGARLTIVVHLTGEPGHLSGTMDSPDQGATGLALSGVTADARSVGFSVPIAHGSYRGTFTPDGHLDGTWTQGPASLPLVLARGDTAPPPKRRPQDPVPPLPYTERELTVDGAPGVRLAGTLSVPPGPGPHRAVVLVTGSGPQDRDEALAGHRPFLVLADALARGGTVVFRYDDRGIGRSTGTFATATTEDFAADARGALRAVAALPEVDPKRVGILGHSEGGLIAALVGAKADPPVAFVVLFAGPGVSGRQVIASQVEAANLASGIAPGVAAGNRKVQEQILDAVLRGAGAAELRTVMTELGLPPAQIDAGLPTLTSPWYRAFVALDPTPALRALRMPVLALLGDKDTQVWARENAPALRAALSADPNATVTVLPGLNHLFQPAGTGLTDEYATIPTTIDPAALAAVTGFVGAR